MGKRNKNAKRNGGTEQNQQNPTKTAGPKTYPPSKKKGNTTSLQEVKCPADARVEEVNKKKVPEKSVDSSAFGDQISRCVAGAEYSVGDVGIVNSVSIVSEETDITTNVVFQNGMEYVMDGHIGEGDAGMDTSLHSQLSQPLENVKEGEGTDGTRVRGMHKAWKEFARRLSKGVSFGSMLKATPVVKLLEKGFDLNGIPDNFGRYEAPWNARNFANKFPSGLSR
jgi:hypothetical protein